MFIKDIPVYARDFKNEYLFILRINNELKYFLDNLNDVNTGLFDNHRVDKIKQSIERFFKEQNLSNFKDVSNFEIKSSDVKNLIKIKKIFNNFKKTINSYHGDEQNFIVPYPGFKNIYDDFEKFCSKFKIKYEADDRFWDYNADSDRDRDRYRYRYCFSDSD